jgi:hypothetical protein
MTPSIARLRQALENLDSLPKNTGFTPAERFHAAGDRRNAFRSLADAANPEAIREVLDLLDAAEKDAGRLKAKLDALDNLPAEDFIRKVAGQMGPPPFKEWPVSHVCQQNADEARELVEAYAAISARASTAGNSL